jgi:hypothetical protein
MHAAPLLSRRGARIGKGVDQRRAAKVDIELAKEMIPRVDTCMAACSASTALSFLLPSAHKALEVLLSILTSGHARIPVTNAKLLLSNAPVELGVFSHSRPPIETAILGSQDATAKALAAVVAALVITHVTTPKLFPDAPEVMGHGGRNLLRARRRSN